MVSMDARTEDWLKQQIGGFHRVIQMVEPKHKPPQVPLFNKFFVSADPKSMVDEVCLANDLLAFSGLGNKKNAKTTLRIIEDVVVSLLDQRDRLQPYAKLIAIVAQASTSLPTLAKDKRIDARSEITAAAKIHRDHTFASVSDRGYEFIYTPPSDPCLWHNDSDQEELCKVVTNHAVVGQAVLPLHFSHCQTFGFLKPSVSDDFARYGRFPAAMRHAALSANDFCDTGFLLHPIIYVAIVNPCIDLETNRIYSATLLDVLSGFHPESGRLVSSRSSSSRFETYVRIASDAIWFGR